MMPKHPLAGQRFGLLTVIEDIWDERGGHLCKCRCDCGNEVLKAYKSLTSFHKRPQSCGCFKVKNQAQAISFGNAFRGLMYNHPELRNIYLNRAYFAKVAVQFEGYDASKKQYLARKDRRKGYTPENMLWRNYPSEQHD